MKPLILILTALHVLAHGVLGCCDHGVFVSATTEEHCVCHHADGSQAGHHQDRPLSEGWGADEAPSRAPHECFHAACHWMSGDVAASSTGLDPWMPLVPIASLPADPSSLRPAEFSFSMARASVAAPPLRLHLALGVMLV